MSLQAQIYSLVERVTQRFQSIEDRLGGLDHLDTEAKANLVSAINEIAERSNGISGLAYTHTQTVPLAVWTVNHNLGTRPVVAIVDSGGNEVQADVVHTSSNQLLIRFAIPLTGLARLT